MGILFSLTLDEMNFVQRSVLQNQEKLTILLAKIRRIC